MGVGAGQFSRILDFSSTRTEPENLQQIPNDQYTCTECNQVPEIINIFPDSNEIIINCKTHGEKKLSLEEYFKKEFKYLYCNLKCDSCQKYQIRNFDIHTFKYCFECNQNICDLCLSNHGHQLLIPISELSNRCKLHFSEGNYSSFCFSCSENICKKSKHKGHDVQSINQFCPKDEEIKIIQNKYNEYEKNKKLLEYLSKILNVLLTTYQKYKSNYFYNLNIKNIIEVFKKNNSKYKYKELSESSEIIQDIKLPDLICKINNKLGTQITGNEITLNLSKKNINNEKLEMLSKIKFNDLEKLNLSNNKITDISILNEFYMPKLTLLNLSSNTIRDISPLNENLNLAKHLENLNLSNNRIYDIEKLIEGNFPKIKKINLDNNLLDYDKKELNDIINNIIKRNSQDEIEVIFRKEKSRKIRIFGENFVKANINNCFIYINKVKVKLCNYYTFKNNQDFIKVRLTKGNITDLSNMFNGCSTLSSIEEFPSSFIYGISNISNMFKGCSSLTSLPDFSYWDTSIISDISGLFYDCSSIEELPDLSTWNTSNIVNMSNLFNNCSSLLSLPNIAKWDTTNVSNFIGIFSRCSSLTSLPNLTFWNTSNATNILCIFYSCSSLLSIPDISNWNISKVNDISGIFYGCSSLISIPDISCWNTFNVSNFNGIFNHCSSLMSLPDISKWDTSNAVDMSCLFYSCSSLKSIPDISCWDTSKLKEKGCMFLGCTNLDKKLIPKAFLEEEN